MPVNAAPLPPDNSVTGRGRKQKERENKNKNKNEIEKEKVLASQRIVPHLKMKTDEGMK